MKLLVISNGHGEDTIAVKIIKQLQSLEHENNSEIFGLPMVGEGHAYKREGIEIITEVKTMPSGGFIYMDNKQLWKDIRNGLIGLTIQQYRAVKWWGKSGGVILAVGDILPLLLAWLSGCKYFFVGTAKSEYYLRDENGWLEQTSKIDRLLGSDYYPWERWLMKQNNCLGVFPRDTLTTQTLQQYQISAYDLGNPMMDDLSTSFSFENQPFDRYQLRVLLLAGSRMPEALNNWEIILQGVESMVENIKEEFICIGAIAPALDLKEFSEPLSQKGWRSIDEKKSFGLKINDANIMFFRKEQATIMLTQRTYSQSLNYCNLSLAMAGTATEQFVGLGKPAIAFAGNGPQYNLYFAQKQKRLLGKSLYLLDSPTHTGKYIKKMSDNTEELGKISDNGRKRLGEAGASSRIAHLIKQKLK